MTWRMSSKMHPCRGRMQILDTSCESSTVQNGGAHRRATGGFTLVETLLSLAILVLLTGIVVMGVPAAASSYTKTVDSSNAQVVLTNATTALRNELGMASKVWYATGDYVKEGTVQAIYTSEGYIAQIRNADERFDYAKNDGAVRGEDSNEVHEGDHDVIKVDYFAGSVDSVEPLKDTVDTKMGTHDLVPEAAIAGNLKLSLDPAESAGSGEVIAGITYDDDKKIFTVAGITVKNADGLELARVENFEVKAIMMEDTEA